MAKYPIVYTEEAEGGFSGMELFQKSMVNFLNGHEKAFAN
jgi:hypothetical protein